MWRMKRRWRDIVFFLNYHLRQKLRKSSKSEVSTSTSGFYYYTQGTHISITQKLSLCPFQSAYRLLQPPPLPGNHFWINILVFCCLLIEVEPKPKWTCNFFLALKSVSVRLKLEVSNVLVFCFFLLLSCSFVWM